jgi:hypothetical protein
MILYYRIMEGSWFRPEALNRVSAPGMTLLYDRKKRSRAERFQAVFARMTRLKVRRYKLITVSLHSQTKRFFCISHCSMAHVK